MLVDLEADGARRWAPAVIVAVALLLAWCAWAVFAEVAVYATSSNARLEVDRAAHSIDAPVAGKLVAVDVVLGKHVEANDVLFVLDRESERLALEEARVQRPAAERQLEAVRREIAAEHEANERQASAGHSGAAEARARQREADTAAQLAADEAKRSTQLLASGVIAAAEDARAQSEAKRLAEEASAQHHALSRLELAERTGQADRQTRIEHLHRDEAALSGQIATLSATIARLEHEIELGKIRSPVRGRIGEIMSLQVGAVVAPGTRLALVVPEGTVRVIAGFTPDAAAGRVRPGQPARVRLAGFPWTQFGVTRATVVRVANEPNDGELRVELAVDPASTGRIPLEHGMPGSVEVEVERASPAVLVLRGAGGLAEPATPAVKR